MKTVTPRAAGRWTIVVVLWVVYLLNYLDRQVVFAVLPQLRVQLRLSGPQLGWIAAIFLWVYSISSVAMGRLADVVRKDILIVGCLVLWSGATLGSALSHSSQVFLLWRAVMGLSESLYVPAAVALIAVLHSGKTRSRALAFHQTAQVVGIAVGGIVGAALAQRFGWRATFSLLSGIGLLYSPFLWLHVGRTATQSTLQKAPLGEKPSGVFRSKCYRWLLAAFAMNCVLVWAFYAWFSLHLYDKQHLSMARSGFLATAYVQSSTLVGMALWAIVADKMIGKMPTARLIIVGLGLLCCAPFGCLAFELNSLVWIKVAAVCFGFFSAAVGSNIVSATYDVVPSRNHGFAVGVLNLVGGLTSGFSTLAVGYWMASIGSLMRWAAIATGATSIGLLIATWKFYEKERIDVVFLDSQVEAY
jgi:MFS family permease